MLSQKIISFLNSLHCSPFKLTALESNAFSNFSLPHFYARLEGFFWDIPQLRRSGLLYKLYAFKTCPLDVSLESGKKKKTKVTRSKIKWIGFSSSPVTLLSAMTCWPRIVQCNRSYYFSDIHRIFGDNLLNTVLFHVYLSCDNSKSQVIITIHHVLYPLVIDFSPAYWKPPTSGALFHLLTPLFESSVSLNNTCAWNGLISIHSLKHFKCFFFPNWAKNFKFIRCLVSPFVLLWSLLNDLNKRCKQEHVKKCNGCRKLRLQLCTPMTSC